MKNQVPTKLECDEESIACQDSGNGVIRMEKTASDDGMCEESSLRMIGATPSLHSGQALVVAHDRAGHEARPLRPPKKSLGCLRILMITLESSRSLSGSDRTAVGAGGGRPSLGIALPSLDFALG